MPDCSDGAAALATGAAADGVGAVAAVEELVLMANEKSLGVRLVADERIQARTGRKIAEHIFVVGEQLVGDAAGGDFALRVIDFLYVLFVNVAPPRLRVADKVDLREFLQYAVETVEVQVV